MGIGGRTTPVVGSRMAGSIPKKGTVAEPGLVSMAPGKGVTTIEPVSVCLFRYMTHQQLRRIRTNKKLTRRYQQSHTASSQHVHCTNSTLRD